MKLIAATLLLLGTTTVGAVTIDFEDYGGPLNTYGPGPVSSTGFTFSATGDPDPVTVTNFFDTQSPGMGNGLLFCSICDLTMTADSGNAFALVSADMLTGGPLDLIVTGFYAGGGSIQTTLTSTALIDNKLFGAGWTNLSSVVFSGTNGQSNAGFDNIVVNVVPIPAAVWLFASALGLLGWRRSANSLS